MDYVDIGKRIRAARKRRNLSLEGLAKKTGLSVFVLAHIEQGSRKPGMETLVRICDELNLSVDVVIGRSHSPEMFQQEAMASLRVALDMAYGLVDRLEGK